MQGLVGLCCLFEFFLIDVTLQGLEKWEIFLDRLGNESTKCCYLSLISCTPLRFGGGGFIVEEFFDLGWFGNIHSLVF